MTRRTAVLLIALAATPVLATPPGSPPDATTRPLSCEGIAAPVAFRDLVTRSHLILTGVAERPPAESASGDGYRSVRIRLVEALKGEPDSGGIVVRFYEGPGRRPPGAREIAALAGRPALFYLIRVDGPDGALYFAGDAEALELSTPASLSAVRQEVARQQYLLAHWQSDPAWPHQTEVAALIAELAALSRFERSAPAVQRRIFARLEAFGRPAALAMIAQMEDRRPLADRAISLENHDPNAFEGLRHYGPETITDALAAILNQITGDHFGFIYNGGTERERREAINGWRVFAADLACGRR